MLSMMHDTMHNPRFQRFLAVAAIFSLGLLTLLVGVTVVISYLLALAISAMQEVIVGIIHSHPILQVTLVVILSGVIKWNWSTLKRWFWRLIQ